VRGSNKVSEQTVRVNRREEARFHEENGIFNLTDFRSARKEDLTKEKRRTAISFLLFGGAREGKSEGGKKGHEFKNQGNLE